MIRRLATIALLALAPLSGAAAQDYDRPSLGAGEQSRGGRLAPLSSVLSMIASRTPGRHLNTTTGGAGGRTAYFVQWQLPDGRVVIFIVDAESGQIIGRQGG